MLCLRQCGQRILLVDEMELGGKVPCSFLGTGRITRQGHACFTTMRRQGSWALSLFSQDSSIGGKLPSYTIYSCICIDTQCPGGVGLVHRDCACTCLLRDSEPASLGNSVIADRAWGGGSEIFRVSRRGSRKPIFIPCFFFFFQPFLWVRVFQNYFFSRVVYCVDSVLV